MTEQFSTASIAAAPVASGLRISPAVADWFLSRGISQETLERAPVASGTTFFPELKGKSEAAFFKFPGGWKARAVPGKAFVSSKGWKPSFWNLEPVLAYLGRASIGTVIVTEGEIDALSIIEAGIPEFQILSVPNGAGGGSTDPDRGMPWLLDGLEAGLSRAKKIIWCGDMDEAGLALRSTMAHQFGIAKFWYVDWPEGCKDANDVLLKHDPEYLRNTVLHNAKAWPAAGLFSMEEMPEPPKLTLWTPEIDVMRNVVHLAPTHLSIVTGQPGHGKTEFFGQVWFEIARKYEIGICLASFETGPKPYLRRKFRSLFNHGKREFEMTPEELGKADQFIHNHYRFVQHPDHTPELEWLLDMAEVAVIRHGCQVVQIDPWNRLEDSSEKGEREDKYILRCLKSMVAFAHDLNVHVQVIVHPSKMDSQLRGEPPKLEDCSGAKAWDTVPDQGFSIHRPVVFDGQRRTEANFYVLKARFKELGYPCKLEVNYDLRTDTYVGLSLPIGTPA